MNTYYHTVDFHFGSLPKSLTTLASVSKKRDREPEQNNNNNNKVARIEHEFPEGLIAEILLFLDPKETSPSLVCRKWKKFYDDINFHYQIFKLGILKKAPVSNFMRGYLNPSNSLNNKSYNFDTALIERRWKARNYIYMLENPLCPHPPFALHGWDYLPLDTLLKSEEVTKSTEDDGLIQLTHKILTNTDLPFSMSSLQDTKSPKLQLLHNRTEKIVQALTQFITGWNKEELKLITPFLNSVSNFIEEEKLNVFFKNPRKIYFDQINKCSLNNVDNLDMQLVSLFRAHMNDNITKNRTKISHLSESEQEEKLKNEITLYYYKQIHPPFQLLRDCLHLSDNRIKHSILRFPEDNHPILKDTEYSLSLIRFSPFSHMTTHRNWMAVIKKDKEMLFQALRYNYHANRIVKPDDPIQLDKEYALLILSNATRYWTEGDSFRFFNFSHDMTNKLRDDADLALFLITRNHQAIDYISWRLQNDREFLSVALARNGRLMLLLAAKFQEDKELLLIALNHDSTWFFGEPEKKYKIELNVHALKEREDDKRFKRYYGNFSCTPTASFQKFINDPEVRSVAMQSLLKHLQKLDSKDQQELLKKISLKDAYFAKELEKY